MYLLGDPNLSLHWSWYCEWLSVSLTTVLRALNVVSKVFSLLSPSFWLHWGGKKRHLGNQATRIAFRFLCLLIQINITESLTKIYYWHIVNKEGFLYNGETPRVTYQINLKRPGNLTGKCTLFYGWLGSFKLNINSDSEKSSHTAYKDITRDWMVNFWRA